jgi:hypothetical protein
MKATCTEGEKKNKLSPRSRKAGKNNMSTSGHAHNSSANVFHFLENEKTMRYDTHIERRISSLVDCSRRGRLRGGICVCWRLAEFNLGPLGIATEFYVAVGFCGSGYISTSL